MNAADRPEDDLIFHLHMARKSNHVRHRDAAPDEPVVPDMRVRHDLVAVADTRLVAGAGRPMDRGVLANYVVVPDYEEALFTFELPVLGHSSQYGPGIDFARSPDRHIRLDYDMRPETSAVADDDFRADNAVSAN